LSLYEKYKDFTMVPKEIFEANIDLCLKYKNVAGCVVECGVWKGGMIAGIAEVLGGGRSYFLFDSFEGLPPCTEEDSGSAFTWQNDKDSPTYFNNCLAEIGFAKEAMGRSGAKNVQLIKGWFADTLPGFDFKEKIAVLRLDGDWYKSTMICLENLFNKVSIGGIIILDDYYIWVGCSKAVHDFLSKTKSISKIRGTYPSLCYIVKEYC
jgi:O-methyltransferase